MLAELSAKLEADQVAAKAAEDQMFVPGATTEEQAGDNVSDESADSGKASSEQDKESTAEPEVGTEDKTDESEPDESETAEVEQ